MECKIKDGNKHSEGQGQSIMKDPELYPGKNYSITATENVASIDQSALHILYIILSSLSSYLLRYYYPQFSR